MTVLIRGVKGVYTHVCVKPLMVQDGAEWKRNLGSLRLPTERKPSVEKSSHGPEIKADLLFLGSVGKSGLKARCSNWGLTNLKITASRGVCSCPKSWDAPP